MLCSWSPTATVRYTLLVDDSPTRKLAYAIVLRARKIGSQRIRLVAEGKRLHIDFSLEAEGRLMEGEWVESAPKKPSKRYPKAFLHQLFGEFFTMANAPVPRHGEISHGLLQIHFGGANTETVYYELRADNNSGDGRMLLSIIDWARYRNLSAEWTEPRDRAKLPSARVVLTVE